MCSYHLLEQENKPKLLELQVIFDFFFQLNETLNGSYFLPVLFIIFSLTRKPFWLYSVRGSLRWEMVSEEPAFSSVPGLWEVRREPEVRKAPGHLLYPRWAERGQWIGGSACAQVYLPRFSSIRAPSQGPSSCLTDQAVASRKCMASEHLSGAKWSRNKYTHTQRRILKTMCDPFDLSWLVGQKAEGIWKCEKAFNWMTANVLVHCHFRRPL